jgi:hypothetical protein
MIPATNDPATKAAMIQYSKTMARRFIQTG